ncbi:MAG: hypothetical protein K2J93_05960 [Anaeroplasmataceae bacterium]|nr:hypothetical protein [Anaeroplasmataceae bacterium]
MKRLIALCSTLCLGLLIVLTSCNSKDTLPNIMGSLDIRAFKTDLSVTAKFTDSEEHDLYNDKVKSYISVNSTGEEVKELSRKEVTISKPSTAETTLIGSKLEFSSLTADTTYSVKLIISSKGVQKTLTTKEVTTLSTGESEDDPILVDSLDMLLGMNKTKDAYYKLTTDIDCGGSISSIFNSTSTFAGTFDGDGHKIYNYKMDSNQYTGLFGYMSGATVKNLVLEDVSYEATRSNTYLGALAGLAKHCKISNVTVKNLNFKHSGQTTTYSYVGGLIGQADSCEINNCTVEEASIEIPSARLKMYVGGFVGENKKSNITDCHVIGIVNAKIYYTSNADGCLYLGGFSGINDSSSGIINCYSKVNITVTENDGTPGSGRTTFKLYVGGFNGGNRKDASRFNNCASIGDIDVSVKSAYFVYVGGFAGYTDSQNIALYDACIYVPKENGVKLTLAEPPKASEDTKDDEENKDKEEPKIEQVAFVSMAVGKIDPKNENTVHVIVYRDLLEITNEHEKVTKNSYIVSQDLTSFSEAIRNVILEA